VGGGGAEHVAIASLAEISVAPALRAEIVLNKPFGQKCILFIRVRQMVTIIAM
jgi:hypothetical protein